MLESETPALAAANVRFAQAHSAGATLELWQRPLEVGSALLPSLVVCPSSSQRKRRDGEGDMGVGVGGGDGLGGGGG